MKCSIPIGIGIGIVLGILGTALFSITRAEATPSPVNAGTDEMQLGIGGMTENRNDACWVLEKKDGQKRLALYRMVSSGNNGLAIKFESVRQIDWDLKYVERNTKEPTVKKIKADWDKTQKKQAKNKTGK